MAPPVILWVMSLSPGLRLNILAGTVCGQDVRFQASFFPSGRLGKCKDGDYLAIFAALEKGRHADEAYVVIPHDGVVGVAARDPEVVFEDLMNLVS